ncbi:flagellar hook-associated protein 2 [Terribacillus sp. DMT04]|nr:flagellar hook-associated protein 2 [Terribacillus sp. DMT04]
MRVGGLASGMDTDSLVEQLMNAERQKLYKMEQEETKLNWQQDSYREINTSLSKLDDSILDMKLSTTYNNKSTSITGSGVTATASSSSANGTYSISVEKVATAAINYSLQPIASADFDPDAPIEGQEFTNTAEITNDDLTFSFTTFNEDGIEQDPPHQITFEKSDSLNDILKKITDSDAGVRAFYDGESRKVILEKKDTGDFNPEVNGPEIKFENNFLTKFLQLDATEETPGKNAEFTYNGALKITSHSNNYTLGGVTFNFTAETTNPVKVKVENDVDAAFEKIKAFVDSYNKIIEDVNGKLDEKRYRDYPPLTDDQKKEMSEDEIKLWNEKAKSGLLKGDSVLQNSLYSLRSAWYNNIENGGDYTHLSQIGINTSNDYLEHGKLIIDEEDLKKSLRENPEGVYKLFSNDVEGAGRGIVNRIEDTLSATMDNIYEKAGKSTYTNEQFTLGKQLNDVQDRIDDFQDYLTQTEDRYWRQFSAMEQAISQMNQQSAYLTSQFSG